MLNISSGIGRWCTGFVADRVGVTNALFTVVLLSGLLQLLMWNFIRDYPGIVSQQYFLFSVLY
jgi:sugar phosphate permease